MDLTLANYRGKPRSAPCALGLDDTISTFVYWYHGMQQLLDAVQAFKRFSLVRFRVFELIASSGVRVGREEEEGESVQHLNED